MDVGIGLPNAVPGASGKEMVEFARRADAAGFSTLGTIDRTVYPNYEPLVALGAAAAVSERIGLATTIAIAPNRQNAVLLAKQAASVHELSGGRLTLGVAIGARDDDYEAVGVGTEGRGARLDGMLSEVKRVWSGAEYGYAGGVGPDVSASPPQILVGGSVPVAFRRAAELGDGWIMGGGTPEQFAEGIAAARQAWADAGREGEPRSAALAYYALGPSAEADARASVGDYYAWLGEYGEQIVAAVAKDDATVKAYLDAFEQAGCDELILFPSSADPEQVDLLAAAAL